MVKSENGLAFGLKAWLAIWAEKISRWLSPGYSVVTRFLQDSLADELCFVTERMDSCFLDVGLTHPSRIAWSFWLDSRYAHLSEDKGSLHVASTLCSSTRYFRCVQKIMGLMEPHRELIIIQYTHLYPTSTLAPTPTPNTYTST